MATDVTRGSTILFVVVFKDVADVVTNPASANLYIRYRKASDNTVATDTIVLVNGGSSWNGSWDSSIAAGGRADWHVRSAGSNKAAMEGVLMLKINLANP